MGLHYWAIATALEGTLPAVAEYAAARLGVGEVEGGVDRDLGFRG